MNKEQLIELKKKIGQLSEKELKERKLYLRGLAIGAIQGPPVGYPSVDMPWLADYTEEDIIADIKPRRMYEEFKDNCEKYSDLVAIEYFENKITYREVLEQIDIVADSLIKDGVKKGDIVTVSMPYLPETIYTIYALNKIGAVVNMVDPRINSELLAKYINNAHSNYAVIVDKAEIKFEKILPETSLERIVSVNPMNSMKNPFLKTIGKFKRSIFTKWDDFITKDRIYTDTVSFVENELAVIEYTSGTSGEPKGVMLSNESFNALSLFQFQSCKMVPGKKFLLIMPPFIAYGLVIGMHNMFGQGQHLLMIPNFTLDKAPEMLPKLIDKYHPNCIMGVPNFLQILMSYKGDLSFLEAIIIGGDHLEPKIEKAAREFLAKVGSLAQVFKGWGMTEVASCASFTKKGGNNNIGSVGIPLSKNNIKILPKKNEETEDYDIDDLELGYDEEGVLFTSSPALTLGYYENTEATDKVIKTDVAGTKWMNTGDIFKISYDGSMYFNRREKRVVVRPDGHNIPTEQIEAIASSFSEVANSVVVGTPCQKYNHGEFATICVTLENKNMSKKEMEQLLYNIERECNKQLQPRDRAKYFVIVDKLPYTMNAKVDYDKLVLEVNQRIKNMGIDEDSRATFYIVDDSLISKKRIRKRK